MYLEYCTYLHLLYIYFLFYTEKLFAAAAFLEAPMVRS